MRRVLLLLIIIVLSVPIAANWIAGSVPVQQTTINPDTVTDLQMAERYGQGSMNEVVAFSPVDERIAVGHRRGIYIFDNLDAEPQLIEFYQADGTPFNVTSLLFSPDGNTIFAGNGEEVLAYNLLEQITLYHLEDGEQVLSFNDDGSLLLYEMLHGVNVLDTASGEVVRELSYEGIWEEETAPYDSWSQTNTVISARFMADDERIIINSYHLYIGGWEGREWRYNDIWTGESFERTHNVYDFAGEFMEAFHETDDGLLYAFYGAEIITSDGNQIPFGSYTSSGLDPVFISEDGRILAVLYRTRDEEYIDHNEISIWNANTQQVENLFPLQNWAERINLNADNTLLVAGLDVYDVATGEYLRTLTVDSYELINSQHERLLQYRDDGNLYLLDANTLNQLSSPVRTNQVMYQPWLDSNDPGYLWIRVENDNGLEGQRRISLETGMLSGDFQAQAINYYHHTISSDGTYIVFDDYGTIGEVWQLEAATRIDLPENTSLVEPFFSPDSHLVLFNRETFEIWIYDLAANQAVTVFPVQSDGEYFFHIEFSGDGQRVLIVQQIQQGQNNLARVFDLNDTSSPIYEGNSHALEASLANDGNFIALASDVNEISVIDIAADKPVFHQEVFSHLDYLILTDTRLLINFVWDDTIIYDWQSGELYEYMPVLEQRPILTTDTMLFFNDSNGILRIAAADYVGLREIDLGREFSSVRLSDDGQRLWIDFNDGTIELWTLQS